MIVNTTQGPLDESLLMKREDVINNENERTETVEYCLKDCNGWAHVTGKPVSELFFCDQHVHRSVHVTLKKSVTSAGAAGSVGLG